MTETDSEAVLAVLMAAPGDVLRRLEIADRAWQGSPEDPTPELYCLGEPWRTERRVDLAVKRLRSDLECTARIETVRGIGYKLVRPAATTSTV